MDGIAGEIADAAVIDGGGILLFSAVVFIPVEIDTVDILTQITAVEAHARYRHAECTGDIEQAPLRGIPQNKF